VDVTRTSGSAFPAINLCTSSSALAPWITGCWSRAAGVTTMPSTRHDTRRMV